MSKAFSTALMQKSTSRVMDNSEDEHIAANPVHDCYQAEPTMLHPNVGDISTPDLINLPDYLVSQKIGIDLVTRMRLA